jgi:hypothetical protein
MAPVSKIAPGDAPIALCEATLATYRKATLGLSISLLVILLLAAFLAMAMASHNKKMKEKYQSLKALHERSSMIRSRYESFVEGRSTRQPTGRPQHAPSDLTPSEYSSSFDLADANRNPFVVGSDSDEYSDDEGEVGSIHTARAQPITPVRGQRRTFSDGSSPRELILLTPDSTPDSAEEYMYPRIQGMSGSKSTQRRASPPHLKIPPSPARLAELRKVKPKLKGGREFIELEPIRESGSRGRRREFGAAAADDSQQGGRGASSSVRTRIANAAIAPNPLTHSLARSSGSTDGGGEGADDDAFSTFSGVHAQPLGPTVYGVDGETETAGSPVGASPKTPVDKIGQAV